MLLEQVIVFSMGGLVMWNWKEQAEKSYLVDMVIKSVFLEGKAGESHARCKNSLVKWSFHAGSFVVAAITHQFLSSTELQLLDEFLSEAKRSFAAMFGGRIGQSGVVYDGFQDVLQKTMDKYRTVSYLRRKNTTIEPAEGKAGEDLKEAQENEGETLVEALAASDGDESIGHKDDGIQANEDGPGEVENGSSTEAFNLERLKKKRAPPMKKRASKTPAGAGTAAIAPTKLDYSVTNAGNQKPTVVHALGNSLIDNSEEEPPVPREGWFSKNVFRGLFSGKTLDRQGVLQATKALKERLISQNVVETVAEKLCESVAVSLEGKTIGSFASMYSVVHSAMEETLVRLLTTPRKARDILGQIQAAKKEPRPYVIVFIGVNGVGKSTSLAKVAYWLGRQGLSVMLAACDTFRSGAIEQLLVHSRKLREEQGLDVCMLKKLEDEPGNLQRHYGKPPAAAAKEVLDEARKRGKDVVLIDTAGRMQGNEDLMKEMRRLVEASSPDLVVFVGEALVGSDGVNQVTGFEQRLPDVQGGILLTKFDTVDDKVGAVVSMAYTTRWPIVFLGCGQTYVDLKQLDIQTLVSAILS